MSATGDPPFRSGFVAIMGRPNVGKSTLINRLVGRKVAIVSDKPQTTRNRILGILNGSGYQVIFIDTPGLHRPRHRLGEYMVRVAQATAREVDAILMVVEATSPEPGPGDRRGIELAAGAGKPVVLVINKSDLVSPADLPTLLENYRSLGDFREALPVSALRGDNVENLTRLVAQLLPPGPMYFPSEMVTDQPEKFVIAEFIREKILHLTHEEIPHSVAVEVSDLETRPGGMVYARILIHVERDSQKAIIIGEGGKRLKDIGRLARQELEALLGSRLFLDVWVKVKKGWRNRPSVLQSLGYRS